jgi:hypothetical protein
LPKLFPAADQAFVTRALEADERVWLLAGLAFLAGTLLQFAAAT